VGVENTLFGGVAKVLASSRGTAVTFGRGRSIDGRGGGGGIIELRGGMLRGTDDSVSVAGRLGKAGRWSPVTCGEINPRPMPFAS
jgi:hypothetical protein